MKPNNAFHQLVEDFFNYQNLPYKPSDTYELALTLPEQKATPLLLMTLDETTGCFLSRVSLQTDINADVLAFFMARNQWSIQSSICYALHAEPQGQKHIMAQCQFNIKGLALPQLLTVHENYVSELSAVSHEINQLKEEI